MGKRTKIIRRCKISCNKNDDLHQKICNKAKKTISKFDYFNDNTKLYPLYLKTICFILKFKYKY